MLVRRQQPATRQDDVYNALATCGARQTIGPRESNASSPESPLSADKQQRLAELLKKYRADEIGPEQYHTERAKILAEP